MSQGLPISIPMAKLTDYCHQNHIHRLSLFGSVLRDDFGPTSDIDILVEFLPEHIPSLFDMARMQADLTDMLGRTVDLRTANELSKLFRDKVVTSARLVHAA